MSSHREAPEISKDPVADSTDLYAFVSPDSHETVTIIANYVPLEAPDGGPNFYEFGDEVRYAINIDNDGDGDVDIAYHFYFTSELTNPKTFLYNTGPIASLTDPNWNRRQTYRVYRFDYPEHGAAVRTELGSGFACPPCNIGPASTPTYPTLANAAIFPLKDGSETVGQVFAGQRAEGFYVDLGAIFDLGDLRPLQPDQVFFQKMFAAMPGVNSTDAVNVHSIAIQVPICKLTRDGSIPVDPLFSGSVIGIWTTASRRKVRVIGGDGTDTVTGPWVQVSRLGNPLFNEVLVPLSRKDYWNSQPPTADKYFAAGVTSPELAALLNVLYPGAFPHLAAYAKPRADLEAILLTGIPKGVLSPTSTFTTYTGPVLADMLRLNVAIPPASAPSNLGVVGGDIAGYPNGRRVFDDVTTIELRAIAGATLPLVDPTFTPDAAVGLITTGLTGTGLAQDPTDLTARMTEHYLPVFPYLGVPHAGYFAHTSMAISD